jgi:hypothetical protein
METDGTNSGLYAVYFELGSQTHFMSVRAHYVTDLALDQLESALRLYFEGKDFASVITLAGAADEIFGKLLSASGKEHSLESLTKAVTAIHEKLFGEPPAPRGNCFSGKSGEEQSQALELDRSANR